SPHDYAASLVQANALTLLGDMDAAQEVIEKLQETVPGFRLEQGIDSLEKGWNTDATREPMTAGLKLMQESQTSAD
ncbi:MAG: hypothetical protein O7F71_08035, partial [Gammaproteobacteria bacterium]|nr:hypothetical protein [Gammaproteobacteria bacterium]